MKTILISFGLLCMAAVSSAQGTIMWRNGVLTPILVSFYGEPPRNAVAADQLTFGLFFGPGGSSADALVLVPPTATIGDTPGVLTGAASVFPLPSTVVGQAVSLQVRAWDAFGRLLNGPPVRQVVLGPTAGPGAVIWTIDPASRTFYFVPEPSILALGTLGAIMLAFLNLRNTTQPN